MWIFPSPVSLTLPQPPADFPDLLSSYSNLIWMKFCYSKTAFYPQTTEPPSLTNPIGIAEAMLTQPPYTEDMSPCIVGFHYFLF